MTTEPTGGEYPVKVTTCKSCDKLRRDLAAAQERVRELEETLAKVPKLVGDQNGRLARQKHELEQENKRLREGLGTVLHCDSLSAAHVVAEQTLKEDNNT